MIWLNYLRLRILILVTIFVSYEVIQVGLLCLRLLMLFLTVCRILMANIWDVIIIFISIIMMIMEIFVIHVLIIPV
ncbi:hypothetical protein OT59_05185 [Salmonella enterica subsp. enterica serovar Newport]|nr:hypothetical protein [Salmonella enterica subsp. enterica serovar Newport]EBY9578586.1 hypothetical protein [Salmonella enterica subsp. enterica serovar Newport]